MRFRTLAPSHLRTLAPLLLLATVAIAGAPAEIATDALLEHVRFLSSDELKGRGNGTPGLETAGE